jgi:hypothetical protein
VKKNSKGGIQITHHELKTAFAMLDVDKCGQVTLQVCSSR